MRALLASLLLASPAPVAQELELVGGVEPQPFFAATQRLIDALDFLGAPLSDAEKAAIEAAGAEGEAGVMAVQRILDPHVLCAVHVNPEARVKATEGPAPRVLAQGGWRTFLVKVQNEAGVTAELGVRSSAALPVFGSPALPESDETTPAEAAHRFLELAIARRPPLRATLSGLELEYAVLQLYSRDAGKREASLAFDVGQGTQDLGFRGEVPLLFTCLPAVEVRFEILDVDGEPTTAAITLRDDQSHVYPSPGKRLAPDFFFHQQVYRRSGESVTLAPGAYTAEVTRGPEYEKLVQRIEVPEAAEHDVTFRLERWIHLAAEGWRSGDHHVHAAGCSHYDSPTLGVRPEDMLRHIEGEDLNVGCVLSWGPCWDFQKDFFEGDVHPLSTDDHVMRYDVEVSGFPSSHCGHLSLLGLKEDDYPGTEHIDDWPSWDLPVLQWAKEQGAVTGFSHSGFGLQIPEEELPSYVVPPYDGIGANEYVVDVTHDVVDFLSAVDTPAHWELNVWYHTLNCGFRTRLSGETDFPCIYGDRVGMGRVYVKTGPGPVDFDAWLAGLRDGRSYVTDGATHVVDFKVREVRVGEPGSSGVISQLELAEPREVEVTARVAALLDDAPNPEISELPLEWQPYWHVERARIEDTRRVPVELVVNGVAVAQQELTADGKLVPLRFTARIERSSWIALRVFPSAHTNPVFVIVGGKPIRASRRSAEWCRASVDVCWEQKESGIRLEEKDAARAAYDHARATYDRIVEESVAD